VSGILTAESWIADYPASAQAGLRDIQDAETKVEESAKVEEAVDKTAELQTQFTSLKESLEEQIAALTQQIANMAAAKGGRKPKMQPEIPAEMAAEDMEAES
jgi:5'-deoxynucleotidase YfbR-like HD superfamily hydrolase